MAVRSQTPVGSRSLASSEEPTFEARDLYRIPLWLLEKPWYSFAPVSFHFRLASLRGMLDWVSSAPHRTRLMQTLEAHLGETTSLEERRRIARRHLQALRKRQFTIMWPQVHDFAGVEAIRVEGLEHLDEALAQRKGAILVSTHFGFARMIKPVLRSRGRRVLVIGRIEGAAAGDRGPRLTGVGSFVHTRLLHLPRAALTEERSQKALGTDLPLAFNPRSYVEALGQNEALMILADGLRAQTHHSLTVAGIETVLAPGPVSIARSTGAAVLPAFVVDDPGRSGPASLRLVVHPPLELQVTEDHRADLEVNLRRFASVYEQQMRASPHNVSWDWVRNGAFENPRARRQREAETGGRGRERRSS